LEAIYNNLNVINMNNNSTNPGQSGENTMTGQRELDKNKTLSEDSADVVDYGRSGQKAREDEATGNPSPDRQRNEDIPLNNDETIGNP
jgi:hypothetical protein